MAFMFVTGTMGGGKSYYGTERVLACLREGGTVMTNLPLRMDVIEAMGFLDRVVTLPDEVSDWVHSEPGKLDPITGLTSKSVVTSRYIVAGAEGSENVVVIDEASMVLDVDEQQKNKVAHKPLYDLVRLCRHAGLDMYLLAQAHTHVAAKLRPMAEARIKCVNVEKLPFFGWFLRKIPWYGDFLRIYYQGQSQVPTGRSWHKFDPSVGGAYDTHGMKNGLAIKTSATRQKGTDFTKSQGKFKALLVLLLILGLVSFSFVRGKQAVDGMKAAKEPLKATGGTLSPSGNPGTSAAVPGAPGAVSAKPAEPTKRKRQWAEWDPQDELPYQCVIRRHNDRVKVQVRGGQVLCVGASYQGEPLEQVVEFGGWFYFKSALGRWIVARPFTDDERHKIWVEACAAKQSIGERMFGQ